jgi:hypothetical protein
MQESRCFTQIYADFSRRFAQIMFLMDLRRSALLICGNLRENFSRIADAGKPLFHADLRRFLPQIRADYVSGGSARNSFSWIADAGKPLFHADLASCGSAKICVTYLRRSARKFLPDC